MYAIAKKALGLLLLVLLAAIPMACLNIGSSDNEPRHERRDEPRNESRKETKVGGDKGVVVEHGGGEGADVKIGGDRGVVIDH